ncbi:MAG TPA: Slp family lipoprotein [Nitrospira sp.]|nr:Slp family lipoprotein [Nitrospira sp.]
MTRRTWFLASLLAMPILLTAACQRETVVPDDLKAQVDRDLRYVEVKDNPEAYRGKVMLAGGKVLSAKRLEEGTRIEVLQIPLSKDLIPEQPPDESKGRFIVMDYGNKHIVDPAILDEGKLITVVGEVMGATTTKIDEVEQRVPELALKHVTVWDRNHLRNAYEPYAGYYPPYAWGYGPRYGYPYYW